MPGQKFTSEGNDLFTTQISAKSIEFVCHDGTGAQWDKAPSNQNYRIGNPGNFTLKNGKIDQALSPPRPPQFAVATEVGSTMVSLSWNPPKDMDPSEIGGYAVYRDGEQVHKGDATLMWVDKGLKGCIEYVYEVATVNVQGTESDKCGGLTVKTNIPGKPGPPAWLTVAGTSPEHINLTWKPPQDLGGASVTAYNVYRGAPDSHPSSAMCVGMVIGRDPNTGSDRQVLEWRDNSVKKGESYSYYISAVHLPDDSMARTKSQAEMMEELKKKASHSLLAVDEAENEGPLCDAVSGKAAQMLEVPRMGDRKPHILLQAFNWDSCLNKSPGGWYGVVKGSVQKLAESGIDMAWLPPPSDCVDERGYLPRKWYNLNSKYGSDADLRGLIQDLHAAGISSVADIVINHRCAAEQDNQGKWTVFKEPDWERWAIVGNDPSGLGGGAQSTGMNIEYAPDIDHTNRKIQEDAKAYMKWLMDDVGFRALRMDFVLGYCPSFQERYVRSVGTPYAVAEYWHGDVQVLKNYINATKGCVAVYDFPVYYTLKSAIHGNDFGSLNHDGRLPGVMGQDPVRSVTFVENHDTAHLEIVGGKFGNNEQVCRAYAFILTHSGIPSIFWSDWADRGENVQKQLSELCKVRKSIGIHCESKVSIDRAQGGLFASYVDGTNGTVAFKMGTNDWAPKGGGWTVRASGHEYCVWAKGGQ
uniref:Fibronectin type-III domain-containing protein n=1 Tax=Strombidinopsis acuminata TaxID=141414 RepID=A0A7S3RCW7_9SPIT